MNSGLIIKYNRMICSKKKKKLLLCMNKNNIIVYSLSRNINI